MGGGGAVILLVLIALVALAAASFFPNMLTALLVVLGLPIVLLLHPLIGSPFTLFGVAALAILTALIHTISDTLSRVRAAKRTSRRRHQPYAQRRITVTR
jgi:membrane protein implicated in regulation of membrane protease activity